MLNEIIHGDCLQVMKDIPDKSVDLIVTDPPYNIGKAEWDKIDNYIEWMGIVFLECQRVLKDNGSFYWFHNDFLQIVDLQKWINDHTEFVFKQLIVWNKRFEGAKNKGFLDGFVEVDGLRNYQQMAEYCLFYNANSFANLLVSSRKISKMTMNDVDIALGRVRKKNPHRGTELCRRWEEGSSFPSESDYCKLKELFGWETNYSQINTAFNNQKTHHSVWNYEVAPKVGHITPKPVPLIENIIKHSSNEGQTVLDPFIGSGTTAIAALNTGRFFIGIEKDEQYHKIACERVRKWHDEQGLFQEVTHDNRANSSVTRTG